MITTASLSPPAGTALAERDTQPLHAGHLVVLDTVSLLDHTTRSRLIPRPDAPTGRYLAVEDGDAEWLLPLSRPVTHVGRGLAADVRLEDPHVSRRHAIVALRGDGVRVLDDRSADGTFVNGREVEHATLTSGDVVRVGRAVFRYLEIVEAGGTRRRGVAPASLASGVAGARRRRRALSADALRRTAVG